jgi:sterol desaturase/sphingolipid hydroxylase (fatty acid hydroxylase superfamily)
MLDELRLRLRGELESPTEERRFGQGWQSGVAALVLGLACLGSVLCLRYPDVLSVPEIRRAIDLTLFRVVLQIGLVVAFTLALVSMVLRPTKILGLAAVTVVLIATALGGPRATSAGEGGGAVHLGLDWFMLNLVFTGIVFVPLERVFGRRPQALFRPEWREDLFYFLVSSLLVQTLTFLSLAPSMAILAHTDWSGFRTAVGSQPLWLQVLEIMFLTDLVQYWVHRGFHQSAFLWRFHAVHHSAPVLDWLAGSRMHFVEIVCLRGTTVIPMYVLGFAQPALYAYLLFVYVYSTYIHSNVKFDVEWLKPVIVTPRFHHWHHGLEREAVDVNFAIHFPVIDRVFGTYFMPPGRWPQAYGVSSEPVPAGYLRQLAYPFRLRRVG